LGALWSGIGDQAAFLCERIGEAEKILLGDFGAGRLHWRSQWHAMSVDFGEKGGVDGGEELGGGFSVSGDSGFGGSGAR